MRCERRKIIGNVLDAPVRWKDKEVATHFAIYKVTTRRQAMAYNNNLYAAFTSNSKLRWFPEFKWFVGMRDLLRYAFRYCPNLEEIELPKNLTFIGAQCFDGDKKLGPDFVIPSKVAKIDWYAFHDCTGIKRFKVLNPTPPTVESMDSAFSVSTNTIQFYVPDESVETYKADAKWGVAADRIHPLSEWVGE